MVFGPVCPADCGIWADVSIPSQVGMVFGRGIRGLYVVLRKSQYPHRWAWSSDNLGAGFKGAMQSFNATRPMIGAMAVGIGRAALDEALAFARAAGRLGDPRVRERLAAGDIELVSYRWLADRAGRA